MTTTPGDMNSEEFRVARNAVIDKRVEGDLTPEVRGTVVRLLRDLARDWQSSDLMDAAAYFEGTL